MRIFIAYAAQQIEVVEPVVHALRNCGHRVFFDRDDLAAGDSYDSRIAKELRSCDLLVFMISPESVATGHYARTELKLASQKWRSPSGYVLPVQLAKTPENAVPPYLRAVGALHPEGNVAAEVVLEVKQIASRHSKKRRVRFLAFAVAAGLLAVLTNWFFRPWIPPSHLPAEEISVTPEAKEIASFKVPRLPGSIPEVVWALEGGFFIGVSEPNEFLRVSGSGEMVSFVRTQGTPRAVSLGPLGLFLATSSPNEILLLDLESFEIQRRLEIDFPESLVGTFSEALSRTPVSLAQGAGHVWVITRDGESGAVIAFADPGLNDLTVPSYFDDELSFNLSDQSLESGIDEAWASQSGTTPASLYRYQPTSFSALEGHEFELVSCTTDLAVSRSFLVVASCERQLRKILVRERQVEARQQLGALPYIAGGLASWEEIKIAYSEEAILVALNILSTPPHHEPPQFVIAEILRGRPARFLLKRDRAKVVDLASSGRSVLAIIESTSGVKELASFSIGPETANRRLIDATLVGRAKPEGQSATTENRPARARTEDSLGLSAAPTLNPAHLTSTPELSTATLVIGPDGDSDRNAAIELAAKLSELGHPASALEESLTYPKSIRSLGSTVNLLLVVTHGEVVESHFQEESGLMTARLELSTEIEVADGRGIDAFTVSQSGAGFSKMAARNAVRERAFDEVARQFVNRIGKKGI